MKRPRLFGTFSIFLTRSFYYIIEVWNAEYKLFTLYNNLTYLILSSVILYNYFKKIRHPKSSVTYFMFLGGFEPPAFRLGVPLNLCHLCSPMYRKVAFYQAFFEFRICFGSPKFAFVVRSLCLHFSRLLDFAKKGKRIVCSCRRY